MEPEAYRQMAANEETHWWFCGRRATVTKAIEHHILPLHGPNSRLSILEVGCGVGGNLALLSTFGNVEAIEPDTWAVETAREKALATVHQGSLPEAIPKGLSAGYDLIALLDVLEHIKDAPAALQALAPRLSPKGRVLVTVPAYPWMFGDHDRLHHHHRRYTKKSLRIDLTSGGLEPLFIGHFNTILLPPAALIRALQRWAGLFKGNDEDRGSNEVLNGIFTNLFSAEARVSAKHALPMGLSILAVAQAST